MRSIYCVICIFLYFEWRFTLFCYVSVVGIDETSPFRQSKKWGSLPLELPMKFRLGWRGIVKRTCVGVVLFEYWYIVNDICERGRVWMLSCRNVDIFLYWHMARSCENVGRSRRWHTVTLAFGDLCMWLAYGYSACENVSRLGQWHMVMLECGDLCLWKFYQCGSKFGMWDVGVLRCRFRRVCEYGKWGAVMRVHKELMLKWGLH